MAAQMRVTAERWPIAGRFAISRGVKTEAAVVLVELTDGHFIGRGESVPYARYGESVGGVIDTLEALRNLVEAGMDRARLQTVLPAGAARNALDCAFWDLAAKRAGQRAWSLLDQTAPGPVQTCFTISLASPQAMAEAARAADDRPYLKLKIGGDEDLDKIEAVARAAPRSKLIVDANEALTFDGLQRLAPALARLNVVLIEQPLPAGHDGELEGYRGEVPLCADESLHTREELSDCLGRYHMVNIKLDKTGGLTEALALSEAALGLGLKTMAGCMVATSLSMAPAMIIAQQAAVVDLDGPLLLARDRDYGLSYQGSKVYPSCPELWG